MHRTAGGQRWPQGGFTLIEMMVVLLIIGVMATTVSLSLRPDSHRLLDDESYRLARVLEQAVDAAEMGEALALDWQADGARWRVADSAGQWQASVDPFFADRPLADGLSAGEVLLDGQPHSGPVLLWQDGRPPLLSLTLRNADGARRIVLSPVGRVTVEPAR